MRRAVVLLSGGLDSTTVVAAARERYEVHALTLSYGQLHAEELAAADAVAKHFAVAQHKVFDFPLADLAKSALTSEEIEVPKHRDDAEIADGGIPATYVPARNTVFLALATAWAETIGARDVFIGVNVLDASGYPDCRKEYVRAFETAANLGTSASSGGDRLRIHMPLVDLTKAQIIQLGMAHGVDYAMTHSCYAPMDGLACGACDACHLRCKGFAEAGVADPTRYAKS